MLLLLWGTLFMPRLVYGLTPPPSRQAALQAFLFSEASTSYTQKRRWGTWHYLSKDKGRSKTGSQRTCLRLHGSSGSSNSDSNSSPSPLSINWGGPIKTGSRLATADVISLDSIRSTLIRQEETIIFSLIERAQFRQNKSIYMKGQLDFNKDLSDYEFLKSLSFLEYVLLETEKVHARVRRYTSPEEHSFFPEHLEEPILPLLRFPQLLAENTVDVNPQILSRYINEIVPAICGAGDDEQHGSSVLCDISALQAISRRIHLGKFVAETKYLDDVKTYTNLVHNGDVEGVLDLLTNKEVEKRVLQRAELKASTYGQDITGQTDNYKVNPSVISAIYRDIIIPLTKDVEVLYLFQRVGIQPPDLPCRVHTLQP